MWDASQPVTEGGTLQIPTLRFLAGAAALFLTGRPLRSKPTWLVTAAFLGGLVAPGLPAALAGGQETPVRTLYASTEPVLSIGPGQGVDSPYELFQVDGAMRLPDGSVVVMVRGHYEVRRFGPDGAHLWSRGRHGEGPGEFKFPVLLTTCSSDNPAGDAIAAALPKHNGRVRHHRALPHKKVAAALAKVRASTSNPGTQLAFEFLVLTACRSAEVRGARWEEIDLEAAIWTIPGKRMKTARRHRVPLSRRALEVLAEARAVAPRSQLVFPGRSGRRLCSRTLSVLARPLGCVPHGFRTSFRNWCGETGVPREVAERCLAHLVRNQVERAYSRTDLLERRRKVMEDWAQYIAR